MRLRVDAKLLIPGVGSPISDAAVVVEDGTLLYVGDKLGAPLNPADHEVEVLMPGLWDCHAHLMGYDVLATQTAAITTPVALSAVRAANDAHKALMAGFTSIRELGGLGIQLARAVAEGSLIGPAIYAAGSILSPTGGHADIHSVRSSWVRELGEASFYRQCDGVSDCLLAVREQLRLGARVIKICASGGVASEVDHPDHQQFSIEEMRTIVDEAARSERVVAAHCLASKAGTLAALAAGVRTIEHGGAIDDEVADAMLEANAILVPTRLIMEDEVRRGIANGLPQYVFDKEIAFLDRHATSMHLAIRRGVRIALGSDCYSSRDHFPAHWGMNGAELEHLVAAGLTPLQAIEAATATAPETLGPQAPMSGRLAPGYDADMIAVSKDPISDVAVLSDPDNVLKVWTHGRLVKDLAALGPQTPPFSQW
jgi:imidazolonepropionase-like amidohydrolase